MTTPRGDLVEPGRPRLRRALRHRPDLRGARPRPRRRRQLQLRHLCAADLRAGARSASASSSSPTGRARAPTPRGDRPEASARTSSRPRIYGGTRILPDLAIGASLKCDPHPARPGETRSGVGSTFGLDLAALYRIPAARLNFGVNVQNLGTKRRVRQRGPGAARCRATSRSARRGRFSTTSSSVSPPWPTSTSRW